MKAVRTKGWSGSQYTPCIVLRLGLCCRPPQEGAHPKMTCPVCHGERVRRSRRQSLSDYALSTFGVYPWRCSECHERFHSRLMSLGDFLHAHCRRCGNHELQRIDPGHVDARFTLLWRALQIPAFRCEPCRYKFFSIRPVRRTTETVVSAPSAH